MVDTDLQTRLFYMQRRDGRWRILSDPELPQKIYEMEAQLEQAIVRQDASEESSKHRIVLHVEDDEEDRTLLEEALKKLDAGVMVQHADSGDAALSLLKRSKELRHLPCLIVLDINLPGMSGKEVLNEIKKDEELASLPLVLFTTASQAAYRDLIAKEKVELITKPSSPSELLNSARRMLSYCQPH